MSFFGPRADPRAALVPSGTYTTPAQPYAFAAPDPSPAARVVDAATTMNGGIGAAEQITPLMAEFFSTANVEYIQRRLRSEIHKRLGVTIDRQSEESLMAVMTWVYAQSARESWTAGHAAVKARTETLRMDELVLAEIVPSVGSAVVAHMAYLRDASTLPVPPELSIATSLKGTRSLTQRAPGFSDVPGFGMHRAQV